MSDSLEAKPTSDIEVILPRDPPTRLDDKVAALETTIEALRSEFKKERFVLIFVILVLFDGLMLAAATKGIFLFFLITSLMLAIALARWLEFPWIVTDLERWQKRIGDFWDRKFGKGNEEIEP